MNAISMISNKVEIPNFEGWFTNNAKTPWFQPAKLALSLFNKDALALLKKEFENIKVPTLAMYGINENIIDPLAAFNFMFPILKNIKGSTFTLIENAKHTPHYENTTKTVEVITNYLK
jgi:pimeloyl-ACP methyl ester carboxylesterase